MNRFNKSAAVALFTLLLGGALGAFIAAPPQADRQDAGDAASAQEAGGHGNDAEHGEGGEPAKAATQWTCSMHPQIKLPEMGLCPICNMDLIPVDSGGGAGGLGVKMSEEAKAMARIATAEVVRQDAEVELRMVGKVTFDETRVARLTAWFGGRIERLYVDFTGTVVKKGDHMLALYSPELMVGQQELIQANRDRRSAVGVYKTAADATYRATRDKLRLWGLQDWQIRTVEQRSKPLEQVTIYAPMGGVVTHKAAVEGAWVKQGTDIYTIADLTHVWVELDAYESDIAWLRYGQQVRVHVDAFPGQPFAGKVAFVNPVMDEKTRTIKVRVHVDNPDLRLKPGMFVHGVAKVPVSGGGGTLAEDMAGKYMCPMHPEVVADKPDRCRICGMPLVPADKHWLVGPSLKAAAGQAPLVIPHTAPLITGKRVVVFVEKQGADQPTYLVREITLGPRAGKHYVVLDGLMAGERVVAQGAFRLDSAMQIVGDASVMNHEGDTEAEKRQKAAAAEGKVVHDHLQHTIAALAKGDHAEAQKGAAALAAAVKELKGARGLNEAVAWLQAGKDAAAMGRALPVLIALARTAVPACADIGGHESVTEHGADKAFLAGLTAAVKGTLAVSQALAADDPETAAKAGAELLKAARPLVAGKVPVNPLLLTSAQVLADAKAGIEARRAAFEGVNLALIPLLALHGGAVDVAYDQVFCPMALDGKGAPWLQASGEVANPYFGASMLQCGGLVHRQERGQSSDAADPHAGHGAAGGGQ